MKFNHLAISLLFMTSMAGITAVSAHENAASESSMKHSGKMEEDMKMMNVMMMQHLGQKDAAYDHRFLDMMIIHHEGALMMSKDALQNATRPEIKQKAQEIIAAQEKEIIQLKEWRKR